MQHIPPTLIGLILVATLGCASNHETQLEPSTHTPAAEVLVTVDRSSFRDTDNAKVELELEHLPPPTELGDKYTTFVVWLTPKGAEQAQNVGEIDYDPASREGSLDIITPYTQFSLAITAEPVADPLQHSDVIIASGDIDLRRHR